MGESSRNPFLRFLLLGGPDDTTPNPVDLALGDPQDPALRERLAARASDPTGGFGVPGERPDPLKLLAELDALLGLTPAQR